jgi:hypothetical protein
MTPLEWIRILAGLSVIAAAVALAWVALRGGHLLWQHSCHFACPQSDEVVDCRMVQNARTGQWTLVQACSALPGPAEVTCDLDCARELNRGHRLPSFVSVAKGRQVPGRVTTQTL